MAGMLNKLLAAIGKDANALVVVGGGASGIFLTGGCVAARRAMDAPPASSNPNRAICGVVVCRGVLTEVVCVCVCVGVRVCTIPLLTGTRAWALRQTRCVVLAWCTFAWTRYYFSMKERYEAQVVALKLQLDHERAMREQHDEYMAQKMNHERDQQVGGTPQRTPRQLCTLASNVTRIARISGGCCCCCCSSRRVLCAVCCVAYCMVWRCVCACVCALINVNNAQQPRAP